MHENMVSRIRQSDSYIWSLDDHVGKEATGTIYKGRHKKKGHFRFIKVLIEENQELAQRECEALKKLDHANVIKLWALEKDNDSKQFVMIMEYCNGGNLLSILEQPENRYGMPEKDFLLLLHDIASGLNHLQDHNIVHRNINPRSIQYHTEDGRHVFKLINFCTARHLEKGGMFKSFYGEPEYQCPEVFERAVLERVSTKPFNASVDLWSVGVTLYQAATGRLPFLPFDGPRKNAKIMYKMMSEKANGCISASQDGQDGPISWSHTLPDTCNLSLGLQNVLCPLLAALLESKSEHVMTFEAFFDKVSTINEKLVVLVFNVIDANLLHIYCDPNASLSEFHNLIGQQTDVSVTDQNLFYESRPFTDPIKVFSFPTTSSSNPIFLFPTNHQRRNVIHPILPKCPAVLMQVNLSDDLLLAKQFSADSRYLHRVAAALHLKQELLENAVNTLHFVLHQDVSEVNDRMERFSSLVTTEFVQRISLISQSQSFMRQIVNPLNRQPTDVERKLHQHYQSVIKFRNEVEELRNESRRLYEEISGNTFLSSNSFNKSSCHDDQNSCLKRMEALICDIDELANEFSKKIHVRKMDEDQRQIHLFEKKKLKDTLSKGLKWVKENCFPNSEEIYKQTMDHYCQYLNVSEEVKRLQVKASNAAEALQLLTNTVDEFQTEVNGDWLKLCSEFEVQLLPQPSLLMCQHQQDASRHKINGGEFVFRVSKNLLKRLKKIGVIPRELPESNELQKTSCDIRREKLPAVRSASQSSENYSVYGTQDEPATLTE